MAEPAKRGVTTAIATVIAAGCGLLGAVAGASIKGYYDQISQVTVEKTRVGGALELERLKFQADLILKAIDTEDQQTAIKTLKFFANAGLIPAYETKVLALTTKDEGSAVPTLRPSPSPYRPVAELAANSETLRLARAVGLFTYDGKGVCTAFLVEGRRAIVPEFCVDENRDVTHMSLRLGYDSEDRSFQDFSIDQIEETAAGLVLLRLAGDSDSELPALALRVRSPLPGEAVYMIHHPGAGPKQVSSGCYLHPERPIVVSSMFAGHGDQGDTGLSFTCRSEGGSAGAPVFAASDNALLGVHVAGSVEGFELTAILISEFLKASSKLP